MEQGEHNQENGMYSIQYREDGAECVPSLVTRKGREEEKEYTNPHYAELCCKKYTVTRKS